MATIFLFASKIFYESLRRDFEVQATFHFSPVLFHKNIFALNFSFLYLLNLIAWQTLLEPLWGDLFFLIIVSGISHQS
jgi:hypothetical protein